MNVTSLTKTLGAEISGIDLSTELDVETFNKIDSLLQDRGVLVIRDQQLSSENHLSLGRAFGELAPRHPMYPFVEGYEQIMVIRDDSNSLPENESWHSDLSFRPEPSYVALLYAHIIPPAGGDTLWSDTRAIFDSLSTEMQTFLSGLKAEHDLETAFSFLLGTEQRDRLKALEKNADVFAHHPVIATHPVNGCKVVYVNEAHTSHILGLNKDESQVLLQLLFEHVRNPRFQLRVRWQPGTLVIWDNWMTQHFASGDHYPSVREMRRVTVIRPHKVRWEGHA